MRMETLSWSGSLFFKEGVHEEEGKFNSQDDSWDLWAKKAQFLLDTTAIVEMQEIPPAGAELGPDKDHSAQGIQESRDRW